MGYNRRITFVLAILAYVALTMLGAWLGARISGTDKRSAVRIVALGLLVPLVGLLSLVTQLLAVVVWTVATFVLIRLLLGTTFLQTLRALAVIAVFQVLGVVLVTAVGISQLPRYNRTHTMNIDERVFTVVAARDELYSLGAQRYAHQSSDLDLAVGDDGMALARIGPYLLSEGLGRVHELRPGRQAVLYPDGHYWPVLADENGVAIEDEEKLVASWTNQELGVDAGTELIFFGIRDRHNAVAVLGRRALALTIDGDSGEATVLADDLGNCTAGALDDTVLAVGCEGGIALFDLDAGSRSWLDAPDFWYIHSLAIGAPNELWAVAAESTDGTRLYRIQHGPDGIEITPGATTPTTWDRGNYPNPCVLDAGAGDRIYLFCAQGIEGRGSAVLLSVAKDRFEAPTNDAGS